MKIPVTLVVEIRDERLAQYASDWGLPVMNPGERPKAKDVVEHVRSKLLAAAQNGALDGHAEISIKGKG